MVPYADGCSCWDRVLYGLVPDILNQPRDIYTGNGLCMCFVILLAASHSMSRSLKGYLLLKLLYYPL